MISMREGYQPKVTELKTITKPTDRRVITIGHGAQPKSLKGTAGDDVRERPGFGQVCDWIKTSVTCGLYYMPNIEEVRVSVNGAMPDAAVKTIFGGRGFDPFNLGPGTVGLDGFETTMAKPGELQTNTIVCAVGCRIDLPFFRGTMWGNCWAPASLTAPGTVPPSIDEFTLNDLTNLAIGANVTGSSGNYNRAYLDYGGWSGDFAWHMVRAYNFTWMYGQNVRLVDDMLYNTAFIAGSGDSQGGASSSYRDMSYEVLQANLRYVNELGSTNIFLPFNRSRTGSFTNSAVNIANMRPTRSYEPVAVTYGGEAVREECRGNPRYRKLSQPFMLKGGVPIGIRYSVQDTDQLTQMQAYISATYGLGGVVPPAITPFNTITSGFDGSGVTPVADELTQDATPVPVAQRTTLQTLGLKHGPLKITTSIKGWEVPDDTYTDLCNDRELRAAVMSECGCKFAQLSAAA